jgi:hypothetical protein
MAEHRAVVLSTYAVFFLGTPNLGVPCASPGELMVKILSISRQTTTKLINILQTNSEVLQTQLTQYGAISHRFISFFYYEELNTPLFTGGSVLVSAPILLLVCRDMVFTACLGFMMEEFE